MSLGRSLAFANAMSIVMGMALLMTLFYIAGYHMGREAVISQDIICESGEENSLPNEPYTLAVWDNCRTLSGIQQIRVRLID